LRRRRRRKRRRRGVKKEKGYAEATVGQIWDNF